MQIGICFKSSAKQSLNPPSIKPGYLSHVVPPSRLPSLISSTVGISILRLSAVTSSGEIAAAYAAGILTSSEALKVSFFRGYHVEKLRRSRLDLSSSMMAVGLSAEDVLKYMEDAKDITVACINSPSSRELGFAF